MFALFDAAVRAGYHVLTSVISVLSPLAGSLAGAAAIVAVTIALRMALLPLSYYAVRGQAAQARLLPQLAELQRKYKNQPERLRREMTAVQQREGTSLFAGVLPLLAQWPFFSVLYRLFLTPVISGHPNALLSDQLLGVPLGSRWLAGAGPFSAHGAVFLGLFALLALVSWAAVRLARRFTAAAGAPGSAAAGAPAARPGGAVGALTRVLPYLTIVIAAFVPLAAGLYLLTTTAWTAAERTVLMRRIQARQQPQLAAA
ncbi:MAG TPA: membrane protein insertase YidC [Streptosporangiaceae bacterium]|jgi:YidC/Oxa1 family membrane protein insertase